jgi:hypothetical protein
VNFANSGGTTVELVLDNSTGFHRTNRRFYRGWDDCEFGSARPKRCQHCRCGDEQDHLHGEWEWYRTLTLYNATDQALDSINFVGQYQLANFTIENDGAGHTLIVGPPISNDPSGAGGLTFRMSKAQFLDNFVGALR